LCERRRRRQQTEGERPTSFGHCSVLLKEPPLREGSPRVKQWRAVGFEPFRIV
jgi:hypothetical protein